MQDNPKPDMDETMVTAKASLPEGTKRVVPMDIVMSLLRPHELEKLKKYIAAYLAKHERQ